MIELITLLPSTSPLPPRPSLLFPVQGVEGEGGAVEASRWTEMGAPIKQLPEATAAVGLTDGPALVSTKGEM